MGEIILNGLVLTVAGGSLIMVDMNVWRLGHYPVSWFCAFFIAAFGFGQASAGLMLIIHGDTTNGGLVIATGMCNLAIGAIIWRRGGGPPRKRRRRVRQTIRRLVSGRLIPAGILPLSKGD